MPLFRRPAGKHVFDPEVGRSDEKGSVEKELGLYGAQSLELLEQPTENPG